MYSLSCFFCGQIHSSEFWEEVDAAVEKCRAKASLKDRGDLDGWVDDTRPTHCDAEVPREPTLTQERAA